MNRILKRGVPVLLGVCLVAGLCSQAQAVVQTSPLLPPGLGEYVGEFHANYPQGVLLEDPAHKDFVNPSRGPDPLNPADELETFGSTMTGYVTYQGMPLGFQTLTGPVTIKVKNYTSGQTGTFATEIVSMSLSGNIGGMQVTIRETPGSVPGLSESAGSTTITPLGGGLYDIDSFFDVFTELDAGGSGFMGDSGGGVARRMTLTPEPATLALLALGGLALIRRRR